MHFWLFPKLASHKDELAVQIGALLDESVEVKSLSARLKGIDPELLIEGLAVLQDGKPAFEFKRTRIVLNIFQSIIHASPKLKRISLDGAELTLQRDSDGNISLKGLTRKPDAPPPTWLLAVDEISLKDIAVHWLDLQKAESFNLGQASLLLRNDGKAHSINLRLDSPKSSRLQWIMEGDGDTLETLSAHFYVKAQKIDSFWLDLLPVDFKTASTDFSLWGDIKDGSLTQVLGKIDLIKPQLIYQKNPVQFERVAGNLRWQKITDGWRLDAGHFKLAKETGVWPDSRFSLQIAQDENGQLKTLSGAFSYAAIDDLSQFWPQLNAHSPKGIVKEAKFYYQPAQEALAFCGELYGVGLDPWDQIPGVKSFNGKLCGNQQSGLIKISSENTELTAPKLWDHSLKLDLSGEILWQKNQNDWRIKTDSFKLKGKGLSASTRFELIKPNHAQPFLSLQAHLTDMDGGAIRDYLPFNAMNAASAGWLSKGFVSGKVKHANILFSGFFADFPFNQAEGVFQAVAGIEKLELDIHPNWPHIQDLTGLVFFDKAGMFIDAQTGRIGDVSLMNIHTETLDFNLDPWLRVTGFAEASLPQAMDFLNQTPLNSIPERLLKVAEPSGNTRVSLKLKIPLGLLSAEEEADVEGTASLNNAQLKIKSIDQTLTKINGQLHFTQDGLDSKGIKAYALEEPVSVDLAQADGMIAIDAKGSANVQALKKVFPNHLWKYAHGTMDYRLNLSFPESMDTQGAPVSLSLSSDLQGLGLHFPKPFAKFDRFKKEFKLDLQFQSGGKTNLSMLYGQALQAKLHWADSSQGIAVFARMDELDLSAWKKVLTNDATNDANIALKSFDVEVQHVFLDEKTLGHAALSGEHMGDVWSGKFNSGLGRGQFLAKFSPVAWPYLKLDLESFKLPESDGTGSKTSTDPRMLPNMQITAKQFFWKDIDLGQLDLELEHGVQGVQVKKLSLQKQNQSLALGKGTWYRHHEQDETQIEGDLNVKNMGDLLDEWGHKQEISETPLRARFSLAWADSPQNFSARLLSGDIRLNLGRGAILKMDPGLGRALGMLNLTTLRRILLLDFSDILSQGLAYDSMKGHFHIDQGQASTQAFLIDAVAAKIAISGNVDLVEKRFDEKVAVIPHTLAALPLAGGAMVGEVLSVAGNLFGAGDHVIAGSHYSVKGNWDQPIITRISGSMSLDLFNQAWTGLKNLSGFGKTGDDK